jgi:cyclase
MIRGVDELIAFARENTTIVPGHGPVGTKALMREYREMLIVARDRVGKLKAAGRSEDEVVAAKPNADYDARFGTYARSSSNFIRVIYRSLVN